MTAQEAAQKAPPPAASSADGSAKKETAAAAPQRAVASEKQRSRLEWFAEQVNAIRSVVTNAGLVVLVFGIGFLMVREWRREAITLDPIEMPKELVDRGLSGMVVAQWIADHTIEIRRAVRGGPGSGRVFHGEDFVGHEYLVEIGASQVDFQLPIANLPLRAFIRYARQLLGKPERRIKGEIFENRKRLHMRLRTTEGIVTPELVRPESELVELTRHAAEQLTLVNAPLVIAEYWYYQEQAERIFEKTVGAIQRCLADPSSPDRRRAYVIWGNALKVQGKHEAAIAKFNLALQDDAKYVPAFNAWGNTLRALRRFEEAKQKYSEALRLDGKNFAALGNLGNVYADQRDFERAAEHYRRALLLNPRSGAVLGSLGNVFRQTGQFDRAEQNFDRALELEPTHVWVHLQYANLLFQTGRREAAHRALDQALALDPNLPNVHAIRGDLFRSVGRFADAIECYQRALRLEPALGWVELALARTQRDVYQYGDAWARILAVAAGEPFRVEALTEAASMLIDQRHYPEACAYLEKALAVNERHANAYYQWARALGRMRRFDAAIEKMQSVIWLEPFLPAAYSLWGDALFEMNQPAEAFKQYDQAIACDRYYLRAHVAKGNLHRRLQQFPQAIACYEHALGLDPEAIEPVAQWGHALCDLGQRDRAGEKLALAQARNPYDVWAMNGRARVLRMEGTPQSLQGARELYRAMLELAPWTSEAYRGLAEILLDAGERDAGIAQLREALNTDAFDEWSRLRLAIAYARRAQQSPEPERRSWVEMALHQIDAELLARNPHFEAARRDREWIAKI